MQITSGQQYNVGEKPTVILYIYINRHVGMVVYLTMINRFATNPAVSQDRRNQTESNRIKPNQTKSRTRSKKKKQAQEIRQEGNEK